MTATRRLKSWLAALVAASWLCNSSNGFSPALLRSQQRWTRGAPPRSQADDAPAEVQTAPEVQEVLAVLSKVVDPELAGDVVSLGYVRDLRADKGAGTVEMTLSLESQFNPYAKLLQEACRERIASLHWVYDDAGAVTVTLDADDITGDEGNGAGDLLQSGMGGVANVIAVSSCKGGVGKSTTAVNLAFALSRMGKQVGILDADIYGPSLPTMVRPESDEVEFVGNQIRPLEALGVKLMSFGYVNEATAAMRGPMVMQLLQQFVDLTCWGELDYLIIDMPPGTGDVQLTLTQVLNITAAVVVTTPQRLSFVDVVKGIDLFDKVAVPSIAVVENMASYATEPALGLHSDGAAWRNLELDFEAICGLSGSALDAALEHLPSHAEAAELEGPGGGGGGGGAGSGKAAASAAGGGGSGGGGGTSWEGGLRDSPSNELVLTDEAKRAKLLVAAAQGRAEAGGQKLHQVFGKGHRQRLSEMWGIEATFCVPLDESAARFGDSGVPLVAAAPGHPVAAKYLELAASVDAEVEALRAGGSPHPAIRFEESTGMLVFEEDDGAGNVATSQSVSAVELRQACRCAACVEELTGRPLLDPNSVPKDIKPVSTSPVGNYAVSINWSDGHPSLYPYASFLDSRKSKRGAQAQADPAPAHPAAEPATATTTADPFR